MKLLSFVTGEAFIKPILGSIAGAATGALLGGGGSKSGGGGKPREFNIGNNLFSALFDRTKGPDKIQSGAIGPLLDFQNQQLGGASFFGDLAQNNQGADLAGQLGLDFLGNLGAADPLAIAQQQFGLLNPILQKQQEEDRLRQESRLFAQGQLGGTPGSSRQNALFDSQADATQKLLFESLGQGLAAQRQQADIGSNLLQLDPTIRGLFQNLSTSNLGNVLGIDQAALNRLLAGAQVEGTGSAQGGGGGGGGALQQIGTGLLASGAEGIGDFFANLG